jgi:hypothetical protein
MKAFIPHALVIPFLLYEIFQHEMAEAYRRAFHSDSWDDL